MSIIIDANRAHDFVIPMKNHAPEIVQRVSLGKIRLVAGGILLTELSKIVKFLNLLMEWEKAGRILKISDNNLEDCEIDSNSACSNDIHVLALAIKSNCRLLYSDDNNLITDFKNLTLISPKGKVIKTSTPSADAIILLDNYSG